jgi:hypothetical protein
MVQRSGRKYSVCIGINLNVSTTIYKKNGRTQEADTLVLFTSFFYDPPVNFIALTTLIFDTYEFSLFLRNFLHY